MFQEDDEETWRLLSSGDWKNVTDLDQRLNNLSRRFEQDHKEGDFFTSIVAQLQSVGFQYSSGEMASISHTRSHRQDVGAPEPTPVAFESPQGVQHVEATSLLLGLSKERAIQVTMSALRSIDSEDSQQFQSLLGTRDLLLKTLLHHGQQRLARLGVLTECLRLEQDPSNNQQDIPTFLDSHDSLFTDGDYSRGLLRCLVSVAHAPPPSLQRDQLQAIKALRKTYTMASNDISSLNNDSNWGSFHATLLHHLRVQRYTEMAEAVEALLVLCYERIEGGVRRSDYALLLLVLKSVNFFRSDSKPPGCEEAIARLTKLAGLLLSESTALWRTLDEKEDWALEHPLLIEVTHEGKLGKIATNEIQTLSQLVQDCAQSCVSQPISNEVPEALALLSFGLLLRLGHDSLPNNQALPQEEAAAPWAFFATTGLEMAQQANDVIGAFDFLALAMECLTDYSPSPRPSLQSLGKENGLYDWQFSPQSNLLLLEDDDMVQGTTAFTLYSSLSKELVAASIAAFGDGILAIDQSNSCDNLALLTKMACITYQNNPSLCQQFWDEWDRYLQGDDSNTFSLCKLLDATYRLATTALQAFYQSQVSAEFLVKAIAPFFQFLGSVCHTPTVIESTVAMLPQGMIRQAILCCRLFATSSQNSSVDQSHCVLVRSLAQLTQFGDSPSCRDRIRLSLDDIGSEDGPFILSQLVGGPKENGVFTESAMSIIAQLLKGAPTIWTLNLIEALYRRGGSENGLVMLLAQEGDACLPTALAMYALVQQLSAVGHSGDLSETVIVSYIRCVTEGLMAACTTLATSLSATSKIQGQYFDMVPIVLRSTSSFLEQIRTLIQLSKSDLVQATAMEMRDAVINVLSSSTGLGQAIIYYATAPVSLTLAIQLEMALEDQSVWQQMSEGASDKDPSGKFGNWQSVLQPKTESPTSRLANHFVVDCVAKMTAADLDLEGISLRAWTGSASPAPVLSTAWSAMRLLNLWAAHAEEIALTHLNDSEKEVRPLTGTPKALIENKSPFRLLSSLATTPAPCQAKSEMKTLWDSAGLSNFDLLLPYLSISDATAEVVRATPSFLTLDFVNTCLGQVRDISSPDAVADSFLFIAAISLPRFSEVLSEGIKIAIDVSDKDDTDDVDKAVLLNGLLSLRILESCVETNANLGDTMLHPGDESLVTKLVTAASKATKLGLDTDGSPLFETEKDLSQLRVATGSLAVLAATWRVTRNVSYNKSYSPPNRLIDSIQSNSSFISMLVRTVSRFAESHDLESRFAPYRASEFAHGVVVNYMALALDILATEIAHTSSSPDSKNEELESFMLRDHVPPARFVRFSGYEQVSSANSILNTEIWRNPLEILQCFNATSGAQSNKDSYTLGNLFDVSSTAAWCSQFVPGLEIESLSDDFSTLSVSFQRLSVELRMMEAWYRCMQMSALLIDEIKGGKAASGRILESIQEASAALCKNLGSVIAVQLEGTGIMGNEAKKMIDALSGVLLYTLDMATMLPGRIGPSDLMLQILELLSESCGKLLSVSWANSFDMTEEQGEEALLQVERKLLACVMTTVDLLSSVATTDTMASVRQDDIYKSLCSVVCKLVGIWNSVARTKSSEPGMLRDTFLVLVNLFTMLLQGQGYRDQGDVFLSSIGTIMAEHGVLNDILEQGVQSTRMVAEKGTAGESWRNATESKSHLEIVRSVLFFIGTLAEIGNQEILSIIPGPKLAQILVRNPLYHLQDKDIVAVLPRGYVLASSSKHEGIKHAQGALQVGETDPVHDIWTTSILVLASLVRTSSSTTAAKTFFELAIEFLRLHRIDISTILMSCGARLTRNSLQEATAVLTLIAVLCKRETRMAFLRDCKQLCDELLSWCGFVVSTLSKFLGASGTARELFHSIQELETAEASMDMGSFQALQVHHPLLSEGIPSGRHEAVKFAHFASRCYLRVTEEDFEASNTKAARMELLEKCFRNESDLELSSRLSVTNEFAIEIEREASACVAQAASILWRMRPASFSYHSVSEQTMAHVNAMTLVHSGMVISYDVLDGSSIDSQSGSSGKVQYGRVSSCDTVNRTWQVVPLSHASSDIDSSSTSTITVRAGQLTGLEDPNAKKAISMYLPAPNTMEELESSRNVLSIGHLILVLRWCHQETLFKDIGELDNGFKPESGVQRLAELATALLGGETSIHVELRSEGGVSSKDVHTLDAQMFELFADSSDTKSSSGLSPLAKQGRMNSVLGDDAWQSIRPQVAKQVQGYWKEKQEQEKRNQSKFSAGRSALFPVMGRKGYTHKSAFRGMQ